MKKRKLAARLTELEARVRMLEAQIDALQQQQVPVVGTLRQPEGVYWPPVSTATITVSTGVPS